jgi:hypothetical protein
MSFTSSPLRVLHTRKLVSWLPAASSDPSGEIIIADVPPIPDGTSHCSFPAASHIRIISSRTLPGIP